MDSGFPPGYTACHTAAERPRQRWYARAARCGRNSRKDPCMARPMRALLILALLWALVPTLARGPVSAMGDHARPRRPAPDLADVTCPSTRVCYVVGYYGIDSHGVIFVTRNGAKSWSKLWGETKWGLRGISCLSVWRCYSVGYAQTSLRTTDAGRTWSSPSTPQSSQDLARVACPTAFQCIAVGDNADGIIYHRIVLTTDGGQTWRYPATPIDHTRYPLNGIACPSARVCYAVGAGSTILVTDDG